MGYTAEDLICFMGLLLSQTFYAISEVHPSEKEGYQFFEMAEEVVDMNY
jgi:hypothetical protein